MIRGFWSDSQGFRGYSLGLEIMLRNTQRVVGASVFGPALGRKG